MLGAALRESVKRSLRERWEPGLRSRSAVRRSRDPGSQGTPRRVRAAAGRERIGRRTWSRTTRWSAGVVARRFAASCRALPRATGRPRLAPPRPAPPPSRSSRSPAPERPGTHVFGGLAASASHLAVVRVASRVTAADVSSEWSEAGPPSPAGGELHDARRRPTRRTVPARVRSAGARPVAGGSRAGSATTPSSRGPSCGEASYRQRRPRRRAPPGASGCATASSSATWRGPQPGPRTVGDQHADAPGTEPNQNQRRAPRRPLRGRGRRRGRATWSLSCGEGPRPALSTGWSWEPSRRATAGSLGDILEWFAVGADGLARRQL